jgi:hemolysin activation/secretion protein
VQFTWVDVSGKVRNSSRNSEEGRTLAGGVGVVGIITEVTLQFRPALTYTKAVTTPTKKDTTLAADIEGYIKVGLVLFLFRP